MFATTRAESSLLLDIIPVGQEIFRDSSTNWIVPPGVNYISAVVIGAEIFRGGLKLLSHTDLLGFNNDGGGNGGLRGGGSSSSSGGGAGGYSGDGGDGCVDRWWDWPGGEFPNVLGFSGSGGAGMGGSGRVAYIWGLFRSGTKGGGVGLYGEGLSGFDGNSDGSGPEPYLGGGSLGGNGLNLRYRNNIRVTPGEILTINAVLDGGARIIWGDSREYPSENTQDEFPRIIPLRYWKIVFHDKSNKRESLGIYELSLKTTPSSPNLLSDAIIIASSTNGKNDADKLTDISNATKWMPSKSDSPNGSSKEEFLIIDLGSAEMVTQLEITSNARTNGNKNAGPINFTLYGSVNSEGPFYAFNTWTASWGPSIEKKVFT